MSTGPRAKADLSPVFGLHPATFDRYLRSLANAGLTRRSGSGGGKSAVKLNDLEIAHVVLSMVAMTPGEAAIVVNMLRKLWPTPPMEGAIALVHEIASMIGVLAKKLRRGDDVSDLIPPDWALTVSLHPLMAWMTATSPDGIERKLFYREAQGDILASDKPPALQRLTVITRTAIMAAGQLVAENGQRSAVLLALPMPVDNEKQTAASSPKEAAAKPSRAATVKPASIPKPERVI